MCVISIIVPVYNVKEYLGKCIDSILGQSFSDFELILIDDGSTDESGQICDFYSKKDNRIRVLHTTNTGVSAARNKGIEIASGEFLCFFDSDDYVDEKYLEKLHTCITNKPCDFLSANYYILTNNQSIEQVSFETYHKNIKISNLKYKYLTEIFLQGKCSWSLWTKLYKADIIRNYNIRICETCENFAEDMGFNLAYLLHCDTVCQIDYAGYYYYQRESSMMHKSSNQVKLNALNEVSYYFYSYVKRESIDSVLIKHYPLIHFWIMKNQYIRFIEMNQYRIVSVESSKIIRRHWYNRFAIKSLFYRKEIEKVFSKAKTFDYLNLCFYTIHGNYSMFRLNSGIYYKWFRKRN